MAKDTRTKARPQSVARKKYARRAFAAITGPVRVYGRPPAAREGEEYNFKVSVGAGTPPYSASGTGALPDGLSFVEKDMAYTGTPTEAGTFTHTVTVTDAAEGVAKRNFTLVVHEAEAQ